MRKDRSLRARRPGAGRLATTLVLSAVLHLSGVGLALTAVGGVSPDPPMLFMDLTAMDLAGRPDEGGAAGSPEASAPGEAAAVEALQQRVDGLEQTAGRPGRAPPDQAGRPGPRPPAGRGASGHRAGR